MVQMGFPGQPETFYFPNSFAAGQEAFGGVTA